MIDLLKTKAYLKYTALQALLARKTTVDIEEGVLEEVRKKGVAVMPGFLDKETCYKISEEIDEIIRTKPELLWCDEKGADHRVFGGELLSELINTTFHSNYKLQKYAEQYYKTDFTNFFTLGAKLKAVEENLGSGNGWHRDAVHYPQFKAILYLSDVSEENGPYQYIEGSHKESDILEKVKRGVEFNKNRFSHEEVLELVGQDESKIKSYTGTAGTLILTETRGLHRGMPIVSGSRYALTNYYYPSYMKLNKMKAKWWPHMVASKLSE